jgi:hypothetical protein
MDFEIDRALLRLQALNPVLARATRKMIEHAQSVRRPPLDGKSLPPPTDTSLAYLDQGCTLAGLGRYNDEDDFLEVEGFYDGWVSQLDWASFWVHEGLYKALRGLGLATDSVGTRKINGYLFSEEQVPSLEVRSLTSQKIVACHLKNASVARDRSGGFSGPVEDAYLTTALRKPGESGRDLIFWFPQLKPFERGRTADLLTNAKLDGYLASTEQPVQAVTSDGGYSFQVEVLRQESPSHDWDIQTLTLRQLKVGSGPIASFDYACTP